jgi:hypothetical protein
MPDPPTIALGSASGSQSQANVLGPGIVGLFIQGIETGMVFSQLATWLSLPRRTEHRFVNILTVFITTVGLWVLWSPFTLFSFFPHHLQSVQTAISFLSSWRIYVAYNGEPVCGIVTALSLISVQVSVTF